MKCQIQIEEFYTIVKELEKFDTFTNFLDVHQPELAIVFGRTNVVDELTSALLSKDIKQKDFTEISHKLNV